MENKDNIDGIFEYFAKQNKIRLPENKDNKGTVKFPFTKEVDSLSDEFVKETYSAENNWVKEVAKYSFINGIANYDKHLLNQLSEAKEDLRYTRAANKGLKDAVIKKHDTIEILIQERDSIKAKADRLAECIENYVCDEPGISFINLQEALSEYKGGENG